MIFLAVSSAAIVLFVLAGIRIDREYQRGVIFRLGRFHGISRDYS
jgi:regulator of protease activity HflC (stomatin/prohibitin superfamily)